MNVALTTKELTAHTWALNFCRYLSEYSVENFISKNYKFLL